MRASQRKREKEHHRADRGTHGAPNADQQSAVFVPPDHSEQPTGKQERCSCKKRDYLDYAGLIIGMLTLGFVGAYTFLTGSLLSNSNTQTAAELANNAVSRENSRAFMGGDVVISQRQTGPNGDYWTILPQITNGGASSAAAVSIIVGIMIINPSEMAGHGLNESTIDPDKTEITVQGVPYAISSIPPHTTSTYGAFSVSLATVESIRDKHDVMYVAGRINYSSFNEPHVIKFCRRFYGDTTTTENFALWGDRRITPFVSGNADLISRPCEKNNCADGDCIAAQ